MLDSLLLRAVRRGDEDALGRIIDKYTAYVCVILRNTAGEKMTHEDIEELASDVFLALWDSALRVKRESLKSYLGAIARNKAKNRLRAAREALPLDETMADGGISLEDRLLSDAERDSVRAAILAMQTPDREIFLRHYYEAQTVSAIAAELRLTEAAVKHRLSRGRDKLKPILEAEVFGK